MYFYFYLSNDLAKQMEFFFSDLCKIQVSEEAKDRFDENGEIIKGSAGFRSGILSRCQSTFESKRENEVATRKIAIEEEPDVCLLP